MLLKWPFEVAETNEQTPDTSNNHADQTLKQAAAELHLISKPLDYGFCICFMDWKLWCNLSDEAIRFRLRCFYWPWLD